MKRLLQAVYDRVVGGWWEVLSALPRPLSDPLADLTDRLLPWDVELALVELHFMVFRNWQAGVRKRNGGPPVRF